MSRIAAALALLLLLPVPRGEAADLVTWEGGVGGSVLFDRVLEKGTTRATLFLSPAWETDALDLAFDLQLRWSTDDWSFLAGEWERPGDPFRPVRKALFRPPGAGWSAGLDLLRGADGLGPGIVLGAPDGRGEIGYAGPGLALRFGEGDDRFRAELFTDRVVDPTLLGGRGRWRAGDRVTLSFEGAVDPDAPLAWSGGWSGGRPDADAATQAWGAAGEAALSLYRGDRVEVFFAGGGGALEGDASVTSAGAGVRISFSPYHTHLLEVAVRGEQARGGFLPAYFDQAYQVERWGLPGAPPLAASLAAREAAGSDTDFGRLSLRYRLGEVLSLDGDMRVESGGDARSARLSLSLVDSTRRGLEATAWSRVVAPGEELFAAERTHAAVSALYTIFAHTLLRITYQYGWVVQEGASTPTGASEWVGGILYSLTL